MRRRQSALLVLGLWLICASGAVATGEGALVIGSAEFPQALNVVSSHDPVATLVRRAVTSPLAVSGVGSSRLVDGVRVSEDEREWRFRLASLVPFQSGAFVRGEDVLFSLRRCSALTQDWRFTQEVVEGRAWVVFRAVTETAVASAPLLHLLSECPVLEQRSAEIFGPVLGVGGNLVSLGEYQISSYRQGREIRLARQRKYGAKRSGVPEIVIQSVPSDDHGLTALQAGTLDVVMTDSRTTLERAANDPTLTTSKCEGRSLIHRTRLSFSCDPISASEYVG